MDLRSSLTSDSKASLDYFKENRHVGASYRVWTPPRMQAKSYSVMGMWSSAVVCPASKCGFTRRRPLWKCEDQVHHAYARSRRFGTNWFSRSRSFDRLPISLLRLATSADSPTASLRRRQEPHIFRHVQAMPMRPAPFYSLKPWRRAFAAFLPSSAQAKILRGAPARRPSHDRHGANNQQAPEITLTHPGN